MMKKLFVLVGVVILASSTTKAQELNLEQVLDKYYKATGIDKLQNVNSIIMSGTLVTHVVMPYKVYRLRPNKYRMERDVNDITGATVYDGQKGWFTAPWSRNPNPQEASGLMLTDLLIQSDFDGLLYNWSLKDEKAELVGKETVNNSDAYKIKLIRKDGGVEFYLIDCNSFLLVKKTGTRTLRDKELQTYSEFNDYRDVDGIKFAYRVYNFLESQQPSEIEYESIELNKPIDPNLFIIPIK